MAWSDVVLTPTESEISNAESGGANADTTWDFSEIHGSEEGTYMVIYCLRNSYEYGLSSSYEGDSEAYYQCTI